MSAGRGSCGLAVRNRAPLPLPPGELRLKLYAVPPIEPPASRFCQKGLDLLETSHAEETLLRRGKLTYICALLLIAVLTIGSHFVTDSIIRRQEDTARLVNLSGRQRMLSQRIVKIAIERALHHVPRGDTIAQQKLRENVDRMAAVHDGLLHGSAALHLPAPPAPILEIYTGQRWKLDAQVQNFLRHAHTLAEEPTANLSLNDPDLIEIEEEARTPLLNALDAAVIAVQESSEHSILRLRQLLAGLSSLMLFILLAEALLLYRPLFNRLTNQQQRLLSIGRTDPLTGCFNRRAFDELAAAAVDRARRTGEPLSILSLDLDHFKSVNDTHGHAGGDLVLQAFTAILVQQVRSSDLIFRVGGEEFLLLLPHAAESNLSAVADRFRLAVECQPIPIGPIQQAITVSLGGATLHTTDATFTHLLARADFALYQAKRSGRNRVELAPTPSEPVPPKLLSATPVTLST